MTNTPSTTRLDSAPWVHVVPQFTWHGEARIVGTAKGLQALADAICAAMIKGTGTAEVFARDGEGYGLIVERTATVDGLGEPYYGNEVGRKLADHEHEFYARYYAPKRPSLSASSPVSEGEKP